jgi:hypothetical protein
VCVCGDAPAVHEAVEGELRCACGCEVPSVMHLPHGGACPLCDEGVPHACIWARWLDRPCPGRRSESEANKGRWMVLRLGKLKQPEPPVQRRDWFGMSMPVLEVKAEKVVLDEPLGPPQVTARPPYGPGEIAGYQGKQAVGLGRRAAAAGWTVSAHYWRAADGVEGCAVRMARDDLRAVATWKRPRGKIGAKSGWGADVAYGWRLGTLPAKLSHTDLERIFRE